MIHNDIARLNDPGRSDRLPPLPAEEPVFRPARRRFRMRLPQSQALALAVAIGVGVGGGGGGATIVEPTGAYGRIDLASAEPDASDSSATPTGMVATRLARLAVRRLQSTVASARPSATDARIALFLLEIAARLDPGESSLLHLALGTADLLGDDQARRRLLHLLITVDPDDATIQTRLVADRVADLHTAESRLAVYYGLLQTGGGTLDAAVRSRIALDAARMHRQRGEDAPFRDRLSLAIELDTTNREATALHLRSLTPAGQEADDIERAEALVRQIKADPLDLVAILELADLLQSAGAYHGARQCLELADVLLDQAGIIPDSTLVADLALCVAATRGPAEGLEILNRYETLLTTVAALQLAQLQAEAHARESDAAPPDEGKVQTRSGSSDPDDALLARASGPGSARTLGPLPPALETIRLILSAEAGDDDQLDRSLGKLDAAWKADLAELDSLDRSDAPPEVVLRHDLQIRHLRFERIFLRLLVNRDVDRAAADLARYSRTAAGAADASMNDQLDHLVRIAEGWLRLRQGDAETAIALLAPAAETDHTEPAPTGPTAPTAPTAPDQRAAFGFAMAWLRVGNARDAAFAFAQIYQDRPGTLIGLLARRRLESILGRSVPPTRRQRRLRETVAMLPQQLQQLITSPDEAFSLRVKPLDPNAAAFDPLVLEVELRNLSSFAAAVGPDRIVSSQLAIIPYLSIAGRDVPEASAPILVTLTQRLSLGPNESVRARIRIDLASLGDLIDSAPDQVVIVRCLAVLGYDIAADGSIIPGPRALIREVPPIRRAPLSIDPARGTDLVEGLTTNDTAESFRALAVLTLLSDPQEVMRFLVDVRPDLSDLAFAWVILTMPATTDADDRAAESPSTDAVAMLAEIALDNAGQLGRIAWLATRTVEADDPLLVESLGSDDPAVRELAQLIRSSLDTEAEPSAKH